MMTSSMTSQGGLKIGPLYSFINEITTFFMITKQRAKISSLNFLCVCIIRLWLQLYKYIFMTPLITSPGHKKGQILKLIYLRQYLNYSVDQKLKMSEMLMAIFLVDSTSGKTSGKKVCCELKIATTLKNFKYQTQLQLHQPWLWFITGGYLVKRWFLPAAARPRGQSNDLNREILASNLFNCCKEVINAPPVPSISRCIHIVYRHKNVSEYQWSNFIYNCMSTFLHYVHCKDALLDCSAPGGEKWESLTRVDEIWPQIWKDRLKLCQKKYLHDDDGIDDVTGWPQSRPAIFLYKWNNIFHDN